MGELGRILHEEMEAARLAAEAEAAEAKRHRVKGNNEPTALIQSLCDEFRSLTTKVPLPLATHVGRVESKPQRKTFSGKLTTPRTGINLFRAIDLAGWLIGHQGGLIITTTGNLLTGISHYSAERKRREGAGCTPHLIGAKDGTNFLAVTWPYHWEDTFSFWDEHPDYPGRGPTMDNNGLGLRFIRDDLLNRLRF